MKKRLLLSQRLELTLLSILLSITVMAQSRITGKVTASKDQSALPGVSVQVKGTNNGTTTNSDGVYNLNAPTGATLVFSFIGYREQQVTVGSQTTINVAMDEDATNLEEVVVTALGIKKEAKKLGYATTTVSAEAITENRSPNFVNTLQGKIAGVNISGLGTGPGGTSKIRIRGQSSISGQNNPLIVVNGVPIDNTNFGTNPGNAAADNS
ncbi:MAG: carboxypeptidase-like regulatory domain-containing protein, partial [Spirosomaceae bacterium]|nr:carboxypeptidase-like regulatory domain-containing protein [Spirosomataceae bacterium]